MAREKMVTRTIESTVVNALAVDLANLNNGIQTISVEINGKFESEEEIKKVLDKQYKNDYTFIKINYFNTFETLYGMPEREFMQYAVELDKETRKPIE